MMNTTTLRKSAVTVAVLGSFGLGGVAIAGAADKGDSSSRPQTKQKVEAAVLDEYPGATIVRTETNGDSRAPYESHITTSDGRQLEVLVSKDFKVV